MSNPSWPPTSAWRLAALAGGGGEDQVDVFATTGIDARDAPARRAAAQAIVGAYAGADARIVKDARGKPFLASSRRTVSIAHSGGILVVAVGGGPVGVDVELPRQRLPWRGMYAFITAPDERLPDPRPSDFLAVWTAKEAVVKLLGDGLGHDLRRVRIPPGSSRDRRLDGRDPDLAIDIEACDALPAGGRVLLRRLPDYDGATVALATARPSRVRLFALDAAGGVGRRPDRAVATPSTGHCDELEKESRERSIEGGAASGWSD